MRLCGLLLGILFLAAQFHFCADLNSGPTGSHICQLCSTVGSVVTATVPGLAVVPVMNRLEVCASAVFVSVEVSRATSPRAPPAL
jgi:hypothetical protein